LAQQATVIVDVGAPEDILARAGAPDALAKHETPSTLVKAPIGAIRPAVVLMKEAQTFRSSWVPRLPAEVIHVVGAIGAGKDDLPRSDPRVLAVGARVRGTSTGRGDGKQEESGHEDHTYRGDASHLADLVSVIPSSPFAGSICRSSAVRDLRRGWERPTARNT
jgi:hypothetical protein